jgi:hypothetical protein
MQANNNKIYTNINHVRPFNKMPMLPENNLIYPFTWLDKLIEHTLNPKYQTLIALSPEEIQGLKESLHNELSGIWNSLKRQSFCLLNPEQHQAIILHYHIYISHLYDHALVLSAEYERDEKLQILCNEIVEGLEILLQQITTWYGSVVDQKQKKEGELPSGKPLFKVLCRLSVDQIGILLKAADDIHLLAARSFSVVLRRIVPFLSTERFENFSWKSARSSTYKMEGSDKAIVLEILQLLIRKINDY